MFAQFRRKEPLYIAIGIYPSCTLSNARAKRSEFRELLAQNIDPSIQKQREDDLEQIQKIHLN